MCSTTSRLTAEAHPIIMPEPACWEEGISREERGMPTLVGSDRLWASASSLPVMVCSLPPETWVRASEKTRSSSSWYSVASSWAS